MGKITTLEERMLFRELARAGHTDDEIAEQTGWHLLSGVVHFWCA